MVLCGLNRLINLFMFSLLDFFFFICVKLIENLSLLVWFIIFDYVKNLVFMEEDRFIDVINNVFVSGKVCLY